MSATTLSKLQEWLDEPGFCQLLGITATDWDSNAARLTLTMNHHPDFDGGAGPGHMHGGVVGAFIDTAATFALLAAGSRNCPTVNYRIDLLRPVVNSGMTAMATIRRRGRTLAVVDVDVNDDAGKLAAVGRASFALLDD